MKTRVVHTRFWTDSFVSNLSVYAQHLFMYAITNDAANQCGTYELPDKKILSETNLTRRQLDEAKEALTASGKVVFRNGWVRVANSDKYNSYSGEKNEKARERELAMVPVFMSEEDTSIDTSMHTSMHTYHNQKSEIIIKNQKPEGARRSVSEVTEEDVAEVAAHYRVRKSDVSAVLEELELYVGSTGKTYKSYRMTLQAWVRRKVDEGKLSRVAAPNAPPPYAPETAYVPPEGLSGRLEDIRANLANKLSL